MGYESKIFIVERSEHEMPSGNVWVYGAEIARFNLSKMGNEKVYAAWGTTGVEYGKTFPEIFTTPIGFDLDLPEDPDKSYDPKDFREDNYGKHCCWASLDTVLEWLEGSDAINTYRRAKLFYKFLRQLKKCQDSFGQLCIVHYGY